MVTPPSPPRPSVAVVIPHLNRLADTAACCRSLAAQSLSPVLVIVVDNASRAHSKEALETACPHVRILRLERNCGFAGAVNAGIRTAWAFPEINYFWVLNNDTICPPDTLEKLVATAEADPHAGLVGCASLEGTPPTQRRISPGKNLHRPWAIPIPSEAGQIPAYLSGASLLIPRKLLKQIGGFDEVFFFFFEDADLSRRALDQGWHLAVAPDAVIAHRGSATIQRLGEMQARCYRAGHICYLRKYSRHPLVCALPPFLFRLAVDALHLNGQSMLGNWRGWREGWRKSLTKPAPIEPAAQ